MKAVILAGGLGTRLAEETAVRPKPMVEIGGKPILWHIMKTYSHYGINDFVICCGYKGYMIKEYFANYLLHSSDVTIDIEKSSVELHKKYSEPWRVTLIDTGDETQTGGRLRRVASFLDETFCFTYGDGVADIDISALINHHKKSGLLATITAVQPPGRYGALLMDHERVIKFQEKPEGQEGWINGGYFVVEPKAIDLIHDDLTAWENYPLNFLASSGQLSAFKHHGFWQPMDTLREKIRLEEMWSSGLAPWKIW